jgi:signal transduction histidine kinase/DNA-binding response OmpR family regulator
MALCEDSHGVLWIGTANGLAKLKQDRKNFTCYYPDSNNPRGLKSAWIQSICPDPQDKNVLWLGTIGAGIAKFSITEETFIHFLHEPDRPNSLSNNYINIIYADPNSADNILWIGTNSAGLNRFDVGKRAFKTYEHSDSDPRSISDNYIWCIYKDHAGQLWIGTDAGGLNRFDVNRDEFVHFTERDGLANNSVMGILEDDSGCLWLSTLKGLSRFNPQTGQFRNYNKSDGLQDNEFYSFSYLKTRDGHMFFGGINGFNLFHPDRLEENKRIPRTVLTRFQIYNETIKPGKKSPLTKTISEEREIILAHQQDVFTFEFSALDFTIPQKNKYAYQMEDINRDWIYSVANRRFVTYTKLPPGKYIFHVKGSNNDGIWDEEGTSIAIEILPPWWLSDLAYLVYLLIVIVFVVSGWRFKTKRLQLKHQVELDHLETEKLREIDRVKSNFFANISHEFRTPLTLIIGPLERWLSVTTDREKKRDMETMRRNAKRLEKLINQLLDLSKLDAGKIDLKYSSENIIMFIKGILMSFAPLADQKHIDLNLHTLEERIEVYIDPDKIEKIVSNLLSNALKFTPDGGEITVAINIISKYSSPISSGEKVPFLPAREEPGECLEIAITNTGSGIPSAQINKIFDRFFQADNSKSLYLDGSGIGLALAKELVELHHGAIHAKCETSDDQTLTIFTIHLPLGRDHLADDEIIDKSDYKLALYNEDDLEETSDNRPADSWDTDSLSGTKPVVCVIEDNRDVQSYLGRSLAGEFNVCTANDGVEGFQICTTKIPDLVISDVMMPKMDGFELCEKLKSDERTSHIPVILLTARAADKDKINGLGKKADDYITKPFNTGELLIRIKNLIEQRRLLRERFRLEAIPGWKNTELNSPDRRFLNRILNILNENISDPDFNTSEFSRQAALSRVQLYRKLQALTNLSTSEFLRTHRLNHAAELLKKDNGKNIAQVAYESGFKSPAYFAVCFRQQFKISPSEYVHARARSHR